MKSLSLVVPVHNGESFIQKSLLEYNRVFSENFKPFEIIVVCNACTDNTERKCREIVSKIPLKILNVPARGKGNALREGFKEANYEIIGFLDADNPYDLNEIITMIAYLDCYEMVIVTKFKDFSKYQTSITRRFFSLSGSIVFKFLFGLNFKDTQAGAKFLRKELLDKIGRNFVCTGFEFDMELLYKSNKVHAEIKEYYISPKKSDFSTVKARILPGMLWRLLKLRLKK